MFALSFLVALVRLIVREKLRGREEAGDAECEVRLLLACNKEDAVRKAQESNDVWSKIGMKISGILIIDPYGQNINIICNHDAPITEWMEKLKEWLKRLYPEDEELVLGVCKNLHSLDYALFIVPKTMVRQNEVDLPYKLLGRSAGSSPLADETLKARLSPYGKGSEGVPSEAKPSRGASPQVKREMVSQPIIKSESMPFIDSTRTIAVKHIEVNSKEIKGEFIYSDKGKGIVRQERQIELRFNNSIYSENNSPKNRRKIESNVIDTEKNRTVAYLDFRTIPRLEVRGSLTEMEVSE